MTTKTDLLFASAVWVFSHSMLIIATKASYRILPLDTAMRQGFGASLRDKRFVIGMVTTFLAIMSVSLATGELRGRIHAYSRGM